jgi:hypothetical protein
MTAALPPWFTALARDAALVAAFITAVGIVVTRSPLGRGARWMYGRLFGQPVTAWLTSTVLDVVRPSIAELSDRNDRQHEENSEHLQSIEGRVAVVEANTSIHATELNNLNSQLTGRVAVVEATTAVHTEQIDRIIRRTGDHP